MGIGRLRQGLLVGALVLTVSACGPSETEQAGQPTAEGEISMGGSALGGNAETTVLGQAALEEAAIPEQPAWVAHEVRLDAGEAVEHSHEFSFVYAEDGAHTLTADGEASTLEPGSGAAVATGVAHRHEGGTVFWEVRLAPAGSALPGVPDQVSLVFESEIEGEIPPRPLAVFVRVLVPPGGQTSVHTHPGPELIYTISGTIEYENELIGEQVMQPGGVEGIPAGVAVQKRNSFEQDAEFLSWFLVDGAQPFASPARFAAPEVEGENLALLENGAVVAGVSSNFQGGALDSSFGANKAFDGDPASEWSSDGDGDEAWVEIELPEAAQVSTIGFWTRTMGDTAQVFSFQVVTEAGETYGPFELEDAATTHYFDVDITARRLRFELIDTSGGNTGAVEIEVYGSPAR